MQWGVPVTVLVRIPRSQCTVILLRFQFQIEYESHCYDSNIFEFWETIDVPRVSLKPVSNDQTMVKTSEQKIKQKYKIAKSIFFL